MAQELLWSLFCIFPENPTSVSCQTSLLASRSKAGSAGSTQATHHGGGARVPAGAQGHGPLGKSSWVRSNVDRVQYAQCTFYKALPCIFADRAPGLPIQNWPSLQNKQSGQGHNLSLDCGKASKTQNQAAICEGEMNYQVAH